MTIFNMKDNLAENSWYIWHSLVWSLTFDLYYIKVRKTKLVLFA